VCGTDALKPHRLDGYMASNDPHFEHKAADIIGLYIIRRSTPPYSAWTEDGDFKLWTASTWCFWKTRSIPSCPRCWKTGWT